eukprot:5565347-Amphidinium_carterae.2
MASEGPMGPVPVPQFRLCYVASSSTSLWAERLCVTCFCHFPTPYVLIPVRTTCREEGILDADILAPQILSQVSQTRDQLRNL